MSTDTQNPEESETPTRSVEVERIVSLRCKCGADFERPEEFVVKAKEYADEYPSAARFFERKITLCDDCYKERMNNALKCLPDILNALAS